MSLRLLERRARLELGLQAGALAAIVPIALVMPPCGFLSRTGTPCPLCGGTRALEAILQGQVAEAIRWNIATVPLIAVIGLAVAVRIASAVLGRDWRFTRWERILAAATFCFMTCAYLARVGGIALPWPEQSAAEATDQGR